MSIILDSHVSFLNLEHRTDRLHSILGQLAKHGIPATRTPGIYPHERTAEKAVMKKMLSRKQVGALGCFLGQMDIMEKAKQLGKHAFVLEDDVIFCEDLWIRFCHIDDFIFTHEWDVIWLGGTFHVNPPYWHKDTLGRDAETTDNYHMMRTYGSFCTYAYIVNHNSLQKVTDMLKATYPWTIGIDYSFIKISPELKTFAYVPGCAKQMDNLSDQVPGSGDWTMFSRFDKLGPYWYQDYYSQFDPRSYDWKEAKQ